MAARQLAVGRVVLGCWRRAYSSAGAAEFLHRSIVPTMHYQKSLPRYRGPLSCGTGGPAGCSGRQGLEGAASGSGGRGLRSGAAGGAVRRGQVSFLVVLLSRGRAGLSGSLWVLIRFVFGQRGSLQ